MISTLIILLVCVIIAWFVSLILIPDVGSCHRCQYYQANEHTMCAVAQVLRYRPGDRKKGTPNFYVSPSETYCSDFKEEK